MRYHSKRNRKTLTDKSKWQLDLEQGRSKYARASWRRLHKLKLGVFRKSAELPVRTVIPIGVIAGKATLADLIRIKNTPL